MNLKETIISSFFFHLILFTLMAAVSSYTTGLSGGLQNIVSVDLTMEDIKDLPAAGNEEPSLVASPPSEDVVSLPDQALNSPPEEAKEIPEPEKKAEAVTDPPKIESAEKPPIQTRGFASPEDYYQFIILHKKIFGQKAGSRVNEILGEALKVNTRHFYGGTAIVRLIFGPNRKLTEVLVDSASPELKAFLEEIVWDAVPAPAEYSLGTSEVQIEFSVLEGYLSFRINAL